MAPPTLIPLSRALAGPLYRLSDDSIYRLGRTDPGRLILPAMLGRYPTLAEDKRDTIESSLRNVTDMTYDLLAAIRTGLRRLVDDDLATIYAAMLVVVKEDQALDHLQNQALISGFYPTPNLADPHCVSVYFDAADMSRLVGDYLEVSLLPCPGGDCIEIAGTKNYSPSRFLIARLSRAGNIYLGTKHCGSHDLKGSETTGVWPDLEAAFRLTLWLDMICGGHIPASLKLG